MFGSTTDVLVATSTVTVQKKSGERERSEVIVVIARIVVRETLWSGLWMASGTSDVVFSVAVAVFS